MAPRLAVTSLVPLMEDSSQSIEERAEKDSDTCGIQPFRDSHASQPACTTIAATASKKDLH